MTRTDLHIKVVVELGDDDSPDKLANEICRLIAKIYGVRSAELASCVPHDE